MTPYEIHVLLDIYALADMDRSSYKDAPIYEETLDKFKRDGLIDSTRSPVLTVKGSVYLTWLTQLPMPFALWAMPGGAWNPQLPEQYKVGEGEQ